MTSRISSNHSLYTVVCIWFTTKWKHMVPTWTFYEHMKITWQASDTQTLHIVWIQCSNQIKNSSIICIKKKQVSDPASFQTWNIPIRSKRRYPLRYRGLGLTPRNIRSKNKSRCSCLFFCVLDSKENFLSRATRWFLFVPFSQCVLIGRPSNNRRISEEGLLRWPKNAINTLTLLPYVIFGTHTLEQLIEIGRNRTRHSLFCITSVCEERLREVFS